MGNRVGVDNRDTHNMDSNGKPKDSIDRIKDHIDSGNKQGVQDELEKILNVSSEGVQYHTGNAKAKNKLSQSLLHIAVKYDQTTDRRILKKCLHKLELSNTREGNPQASHVVIDQKSDKAVPKNNDERDIPTAFHVAIIQGNYKAVKMLLEFVKKKGETKTLLEFCAEGKQFKNTVLMAQLPMSVAALVLKAKDSNSKDIVDHLLKNGACISKKNKDDDTLFHSLIKYADIYPDKIFDITFAFKYLWEKYTEKALNETNDNNKITDILFWENDKKLTPLQLSAKLGISEIFDYIINITNVYCFQNTKDGLFDIRRYDVTEFDRLLAYIDKNPKNNSEGKNQKHVDDKNISEGKSQKPIDQKHISEGKSRKPEVSEGKSRKLTILELLFDSRCTLNEAFQILNQKVVKFILQRKWNTYWIFMIIWLIMHFLFISVATMITVEKSNDLVCIGENLDLCDLNESRIGTGVVYLVFGLTYLFIAVMAVHKLAVRCYCGGLGLIWHNLDYIICLIVVSLCAILESMLCFLQIHWDYHLICLLLCGWYFMLYFSPFHKNLVAFTYMMKAGLLGDFIPFSFIFTFILISFTTVMHVLFKGTGEDPEEFHIYRESLLTMFKLSVGLDDIGVLNQSRIPWLAYTMFVLFTILSFIHLLNALIAIMSQTFSDVHNKKSSYHKFQRLCMIELFEDIIINPSLTNLIPESDFATQFTKRLLSHSQSNGTRTTSYRYLETIHSLDDSFYERDDKEEKTKSDVQMNVNQVIDLIRNGNNELLDLIQNGDKRPENNEVTYIVEKTYRDQSHQFPVMEA